MIKLEEEFNDTSFSYKQIWRDDKYAIYKKSFRFTQVETSHFETIIIQHWKEREIHGKVYPESEGYPNSNMWGTNGFTLPSETSAHKKVEKLKEKAAALILTKKK